MYSLSVSSIAWDETESVDIAQYLRGNNVKNVELAPTKIWPDKISVDPSLVTEQEIKQALDIWTQNDITPVAMQSMLFLRPDLVIFGAEEKRLETLDYLKKFIALSARMGINVMVFGSPKNRQRGEVDIDVATKIARNFFKEIGDFAYAHGVNFCIEPNPTVYNCDFVVNAKEGADFVRSVNSKGFWLHLDAAGMALAGDDITQSITQNSDILKHFHISAPQLGEIEANGLVDHMSAAKALNSVGYDRVVSIEMRPGEAGSNATRVESAIQIAQTIYFN